jgi:hypothetical protein
VAGAEQVLFYVELVDDPRAATFAALPLTAARWPAGDRGAPPGEHRSHDEVFLLAARHAEASARDLEHEFQSTQITSVELRVQRDSLAVVRDLCPAGGAMPGHMNVV